MKETLATGSRQTQTAQVETGSLPGFLLAAGVVLALALLLIAPLWREAGLPNSADGPLHLHRSAAVARSFADGLFWPRWYPDVYGGLGAPTFHYYSPLFYLLTGGLHWLGLSLDTAAKAILSVTFLVSGLATYGWIGRLLAVPAAAIGTALYLAQPHFFREYYFQGDYPQLLALFLLPCTLWSFTALHDEGRWPHWLLAPLSLSLLVTAHNLTAMVGAVLLLIYWLLLGAQRRNWRGWTRGVGAALMAALLSAFFWLPALGDTGLVQVDNLQQDFFRYDQYFLIWQELLARPQLLDARAANPPFAHSLGWAAWFALLAAMVTVGWRLLRHRSGGTTTVWTTTIWTMSGVLLALGFSLLTLPVSSFVWRAVPGLDLLQFPSRLLAPATVGVALAGGGAVMLVGVQRQWLAASTGIVVIALTSAVFLFPAHHYLRTPTLTAQDTRLYEEQSGIWGMTSGNEFLPRWADASVATDGQQSVLDEDAQIQWTSPHAASIRQPASSASGLTIPVHYFPAWIASAGNVAVAVSPSETGQVQLEPSAPVTQIDLQWRGTAWQRRGEWLSWMGAILWLAVVAVAGMRRAGRRLVDQGEVVRDDVARYGVGDDAAAASGVSPLALLPLVTLLLLGLARQGIANAELGWFQRYSPPGEVEGVTNPTEITVGGHGQPSVSLLGWDLVSPARPRPGETVRLRLYWQASETTDEETMDEDLHSFAHLYTPDRQRSWVIAQNMNPGRIPTSRWRPSLYYVDEVDLSLPVDLPPAQYTVAVGMVTAAGTRLSSPTGDGLIHLTDVNVRPLQAASLRRVQPDEAVRAAVGDALSLSGYDLLPAPGGPILRLYWAVTGRVQEDYSTFVHLYDAEGGRIAQFDGPPLAGMLPTSDWQRGSLLIDRRQLVLPPDIAAGDYVFEVGLYHPDEGQPLPVTPAEDAMDHFVGGRALRIPLYVPSD